MSGRERQDGRPEADASGFAPVSAQPHGQHPLDERQIKLHLLESLARSQRALSAILEQIGELGAVMPELPKAVLRNMELIAKYQGLLAEKATGMRLRAVHAGKPQTPWLQRGVARAGRGPGRADAKKQLRPFV